MNPTRIELAVEQMESYDEAADFEYSCDDIRTAWLSAELSRRETRTGVDALWLDR